MEKICKMLKRNNKGFTLVELMVVLLIIGILVAIAIPIYNRTQDNAKQKTCIANLRTIDGAIAQYAAENNTTVAEFGNANSGKKITEIDGLGDYLKDIGDLKCPAGTDEKEGTYSIDSSGKAVCDCNGDTDDKPHKYPLPVKVPGGGTEEES
ncbi:MAG TPA: type II secretion system protein [Syntrophomonadaceae bacterium]|nr:type II secretion system protein [Syntrophomonadaceae bacterium]